ncbi:unnamed protein product, partial [Coregonus sp. 'balchen']
YQDLQDSMTDALVNDKPQFVRLFTENGLNILDYLTYGRLESLYRSVADSSLAYALLQRRLGERQGMTGSQAILLDVSPAKGSGGSPGGLRPANKFSLFEVSRVLEDLMGDVCQPFYHAPLELENITSQRKALKRVSKLLRGNCVYRDKRCLFPWASLFVWAVLQNRNDMAVFFWEMAGESVLSALSGCKILRELSKLESQTETKLAMKELAQRKSPVWGGTTCLKMGMAADARLFFSHDGVQSLLSQIWWGDMKRSTEVWKLLLTFFCPVLMYTQLISFRELEEPGKPDEVAQGRDNDSLYGETIFSFSDIKHMPNTPPKRPFVVSRWRQFWFAPVTSFLGNVLMYFLFLLLFAYVLLVDFKPPPPRGPAIAECVLYFWVFTIVCEEIRETFLMGSMTWHQRMRKYVQDVWNKCVLTAASPAVGKEWDMECTDNVTLIEGGAEPCRSQYANWLVIILLVIYLLVTNILLINLLIAMFSYTFSKVQFQSDTYWKFQRYNLIVEYHSRPSLAPPFIFLSHFHLFIKRYIRKVPSVKILHFGENSTQGKAANRLMTWEAIQKENFLTAQSKIQRGSDSERLKRMSVKTIPFLIRFHLILSLFTCQAIQGH